MSSPFKIAIAGLGTVGSGTARILLTQAEHLARHCGRRLQVVAWADPDRNKDRGVDLSPIPWFDDARRMIAQIKADAVVELIGGAEGIAKEVCHEAIEHTCHVVTANKALMAHHGFELACDAEKKSVCLAFEAAVAGGIPIIKAVREGLAANKVSRVIGILNGTCNHILSTMASTGRPFADILKESQDLGYAEADPGFDIDGVDSAHKIALLAATSFGLRVDFDAVHIEGIRTISPIDIAYAKELGFCIKLLGICSQKNGATEQRVHPCLVPQNINIARVEGVENAVRVDGDAVGPTFYQGAGAGGQATGSAVVADLVDLARGNHRPVFAIPATELKPLRPAPISTHRGKSYIRFMVEDKPGVVAHVTQCLSDHGISVETLLQHGKGHQEDRASVPVIIVTHACKETDLQAALEASAQIAAITAPPLMIRIESFDA